MDERARVFGEACGPTDAALMFVGEAPGRLGADQSGIPFHGDRSGHNFEELLEFARISRNEIFVTNAVLCNPRDDGGRNAPPTSVEIANCTRFLKRQIDTIKPKLVVTLGASALRSAGIVEGHDLTLSDNVRTAHEWYGRTLVPLYHPGQRAMVHRSFANQRSDYAFVAKCFRGLEKVRGQRSHAAGKEHIANIAAQLIERAGRLSYFALHKLFYLFEWNFFESNGRRYTDAYIVRQLDGPYCTDLHIVRLQKRLPGLVVSKSDNELFLQMSQKSLELEKSKNEDVEQQAQKILDEVMHKYGRRSNAELKRSAYMTRPMRQILRREKSEGRSLYNSSIEFSVRP